jgi:membrane-associated protease RseP (regulator of RpoE activity)
MNWDLISVMIFYGLLLLLFFRFRDKFVNQGLIVLYKSKIGLKLMDRIAKKFPRFLSVIAFIGVVVCLVGMVFVLYFLIKETLNLILVPGTAPALTPIIPGIEVASGFPVLSFWHWIITIFAVALLHEFSHGVIARLFNVQIKSSGFAFLGPLLAAFVEPEEEQLEKKSVMRQLKVFCAGPFSNLLFGVIVLLFLFLVFVPLTSNFYTTEGIIVSGVMEGYPINQSGIEPPFIVTSVNGEDVLSFKGFTSAVSDVKPNETVLLGTNKGEYEIVTAASPENSTQAFFGITSLEEYKVYNNEILGEVIEWIELLLLWLFLISVGVAMFNVLPIGPVDGGRMFYAVMLGIFKKESVAKKLMIVVTIFCIALIVINMIPWISKLLLFIWHLILILFSFF